MSTTQKYWDRYANKNKTKDQSQTQMTDRQTYITFLEVQLERVQAAVMNIQEFSERIEQVQSQVNTLEDRVINVSKLVKLQRNYGETWEEELNKVKEQIQEEGKKELKDQEQLLKYEELGSKVDDICSKFGKLEEKLTQKSKQDEERKQSSLKENKQLFEQQEKKLTKLISDIQNQYELRLKEIQDQFGQQSKEQNDEINALQRQIEQMQIMSISQQIPDQATGKSAQVQQELNNSLEKSLLQSSIGIRTRAWEKEIESRLFRLESQIQEKLEVEDLEKFKEIVTSNNAKQSGKIQELAQLAYNSELACNHAKENLEKNIQKYNSRLQEFQGSVRNIEIAFKGLSKNEQNIGISSIGINLEMLQEIEKKLNKKIATSVEKLGEIMKKQASIQKGLNDKIIKLERDASTKRSYKISLSKENSQDKVRSSVEKNQRVFKENQISKDQHLSKKQIALKSQPSAQKQSQKSIHRTPSPRLKRRIGNENSSKLTSSIDKSLKELNSILPKQSQSHSNSFRSPYGKVKTFSDISQKTPKQGKKLRSKSRSKTPENKKTYQSINSSRSQSQSRTPRQKISTPKNQKLKSPITSYKSKRKQSDLEKKDVQVSFHQQEQKKQKIRVQKPKQSNEQQEYKKKDSVENTNDRRKRLEAIYQELSHQK